MLVFLVLVVGMLDLGIAVFQHHVLAQASRELAREVIVHGELADRLGPWGPAAYSGVASDAHPIADVARAFFEGDGTGTAMIAPGDVNIQVVWLNGTNAVEEPVRVSLSSSYTLLSTSLIPFTNPSIDLTASSEMTIAH